MWKFSLLALCLLLPSCVVMSSGKPVDFEKDLPQETLDYYRCVKSIEKDGDTQPITLGGTFFTLFPIVLAGEGLTAIPTRGQAPPAKEFVGTSFGLHLFGLIAATQEISLFSPEGKLLSQDIKRSFLTGLLYRDWSQTGDKTAAAEMQKVEGWSILWGFFGREVKNGKSDWTFFWFL